VGRVWILSRMWLMLGFVLWLSVITGALAHGGKVAEGGRPGRTTTQSRLQPSETVDVNRGLGSSILRIYAAGLPGRSMVPCPTSP
jgi:hypothetical protein